MLKIFNVRTFNFSSDVVVSLSSKGFDKVPNFTLSCSFKVFRFSSCLPFQFLDFQIFEIIDPLPYTY